LNSQVLEHSNASTKIAWDPPSRVATSRYTLDACLSVADGDFLVDALTGWIGADGAPFALLADATGLGGSDAPYRAKTGEFFRRHIGTGFIAIFNMAPIIQVVGEMFRVGTGVALETFATEALARMWLRTKGIAA
jgi:hypothetical protein